MIAKKFQTVKDAAGKTPIFNNQVLLDISTSSLIEINEDTPFLYGLVTVPEPVICKLTYISQGYISPGKESGCSAWIKIKNNENEPYFKMIDLSPEWITLEHGNVLYVTGARVFDENFIIQLEMFKAN